MTAPTIDQTLALLVSLAEEYDPAPEGKTLTPNMAIIDFLHGHDVREIFSAITEKLQSSESQPVPVEPEIVGWLEHHKGGDNLNWERVDHSYAKADALIKKSDYDSLQSALQRAQEERDKFKSYWLAIDNRMVVLHLGTADSFDADTCMNKILEWETTIALDPQVSRPAQELKDTHLQRAEKAEATNRRMVELLKEPSAYMVHFTTKLGGAIVADRITVWRKESAKDHVREELITKINPLYELSAELLKEV